MKTRPALLIALLVCSAAALRGEDGPAGPPPPPETTAAPAPPSIEYIPLRGVAMRTSDNQFEIALGFNLQARFTRFDFAQGPGAADDADEFRVRRFKLYLTGHAFDPRLTYRFQLAFENASKGGLLLDDAWMNYKFREEVAVQAGQAKTPYARDELYNDGVVQFQERATSVEALKPGRDIGADLLGSVADGRLTYVAGVYGGAGQSATRTTGHVMPMVRLVFNPFGELGLGVADLEGKPKPLVSFGIDGFTNTLRKTGDKDFESNVPNYAAASGWLGRGIALFTTGEDVAIASASADVQFKWRGFSAQAEYLGGRARGDASGVILRAVGWYAQAGYLILPHRLDLALRFSAVDANRARSGDESTATTVITDYYIHRQQLKLQGEYTRTHRRASGQFFNDNAYRLQAQLML